MKTSADLIGEERAVVRVIEAADELAVLDLWRANALEAAGRPLGPQECRDIQAALEKYAAHPQALCLVAELEGRVVGFLTAYSSSHPVLAGRICEIEELYVKPEVRRRALARALVRRALEQWPGVNAARAQACAEAGSALAFWRGFGWKEGKVFHSYDD